MIFTARKRSYGQGKVFTLVCHSVHRGSLSQHASQVTWSGGFMCPWGSLSRGVYVQWGLCQGDPPYIYFRVVHILQECILVTGCNKVVAKVMFLQVCVCPQGGRVSVSVYAGMPDSPPPWARQTPPRPGRPPGPGRCPPPPGPGRPPRPGRHPPGWGRHPPGKQTPAYGLRAAGTQPTGMHSCSRNEISGSGA